MNITEILKDLKNIPNPEFVGKILKRNGWNLLGVGLEAAVAEHPDKKYVLKIFDEDSIYKEFVEYSKEHQDNPHVPKFNRYIKRIPGTKFSYVRMEKLKDFREVAKNNLYKFAPDYVYMLINLRFIDELQAKNFDDLCRKYKWPFKNWQEFLIDSENDDFDYDIIWNDIGQPDLIWKNLIKDLMKFADNNSMSLDLHDKNIMVRGSDTIVVTDPYY